MHETAEWKVQVKRRYLVVVIENFSYDNHDSLPLRKNRRSRISNDISEATISVEHEICNQKKNHWHTLTGSAGEDEKNTFQLFCRFNKVFDKVSAGEHNVSLVNCLALIRNTLEALQPSRIRMPWN